MSILPSDEQIVLRESARQFLADSFPMEKVRTFMEGTEEVKRALHRTFWETIAELGWLSVLWDEDSGGIGLGHREVAIILEELGRALVPSAYLPTLLAGSLVERLLPKEESRRWLQAIAAGELSLSLTVEDPLGRDDALGPCRAQHGDDAYSVDGTRNFVPHAPDVDRLLVPAATPEGEMSWFWVAPDSPGVTMEALETMDATRPLYRVSFEGAKAHALGPPGSFESAWREVEPFYWSALASESAGGSERVLEEAVQYAKERVQFDVPIGAQQAIKHKCANMLIRSQGSHSIASRAARALDEEEPDASLLCSMAKTYASEAYREISAEGIQIHGGVGFTWEFDCHLFYKRARANAILGGHADAHREKVAAEGGLEA